MAKKTYIAQSEHRGLLPPKKDPQTGLMEEHVLPAGGEISLDEEVGQKLVDGKSMVEKGGKPASDPKEA